MLFLQDLVILGHAEMVELAATIMMVLIHADACQDTLAKTVEQVSLIVHITPSNWFYTIGINLC